MKRLISVILSLVVLLSVTTGMTITSSAADYIFPVLGSYSISSPYGSRNSGYHYGIDVATSGQANIVVATASGTVVSVANSCPHVSCGYQCEHYSTYGNMVAIRHNDGKCSYYGHLKKDSIKVSVGDNVIAGQQIANVGSSGYSTGYHLHFEIRTSYGATRSTSTCLNVNPSSLAYTYIDSPVSVNNTETYVNVIDNYANISWYAYPGATVYNVRIKKIVNGAETSDDYSIWNVSTPYTGKEFENGYYKVYVDAVCSSGTVKYSETYFTINSSNSINPTNVSVTNSTAKFSWAAYSGASVYNVRIKRIVDGAETSEDYSAWSIKSTSTSVELPDGTYRAYVDAVCSNSTYKYKNASFTIKSATRKTNILNQGRKITFSWKEYPTATLYNVRIKKIENGKETDDDYSIWNVETTSATKTFEPGEYKAYVDAIYKGGIYKYEEANFSISETCSHLYLSKVTKEATCTSTGIKTFTCSLCGDSYTETIPKIAHTPVKDSAVAATCTKSGKTEGNHCSVCGTVITAQTTIPALGHSFDSNSKYCKNGCGTVNPNYKEEPETCDHNVYETYEVRTKKAGIGYNGKYEIRCSNCNKTLDVKEFLGIERIELSTTTYTYNGNVKKPKAYGVYYDENRFELSDGYADIKYDSGRKNVGEYKVNVKLKGAFEGSKTLRFTINPKGTSISTVSSKSKGFAVKWNKQTTQTTGYQIQYATNSSFTSNKKTVTVSSNKTTSKTIKKLKGKKKYYVRIRTYKTVNGKKYYSSWSKARTVTTKK
ncbi:MAG: M23 family metallopeptidase [Eubacterium sp.]|nr:M23 family metallopeptidase [Eubacterium sp.]